MPSLERQARKWGGARIGSGAKKGSKHPATIERERTQESTLKEMEQYIQARWKELIDTMFMASKKDWRAAEALTIRGWGKPAEKVVHSGGIGVLHLIKSLNAADGNSGQTED